MIKVVEDQTKIAEDLSEANIVIESTNPDMSAAMEELQSTSAKSAAITYAVKAGVVNPRLTFSGFSNSVYPVTKDGETVEGPIKRDAEGDDSPTRYRIDFKVISLV